MLGKGLDKNGLGHLDTFVEVGELLEVLRFFRSLKLVGRDHCQGTVKVVNAVDEILCEFLDSKVAGSLDFTSSAILQVAEIGDSAEAFILRIENQNN